RPLHSLPTRRSSDLAGGLLRRPREAIVEIAHPQWRDAVRKAVFEQPETLEVGRSKGRHPLVTNHVRPVRLRGARVARVVEDLLRSEEHTSELQSREK